MTTATIMSWSLRGAAAAAIVVVSWALSLAFLLTREIGLAQLPELLAWAIPAIALQTFLHTGLFITAHDAMHGTVVPAHRRINDAIGTLAVILYALFSFRKLHEKHGEHHGQPGVPGEDPDYHDGHHGSFWRWYAHFIGNYVGLWQIVGMAAVFNLLEHVAGVPLPNLIVFWVVPSLLSTLQLFYFGTYLPHREPHAHDDPHRARSNAFAPWLSFLTCYHFGYHREHHIDPSVPWWRLPQERAAGDS